MLLGETTHTHTHTFNGPLSGTTQVSRYQKGKTNLDFTEARDSEWNNSRWNNSTKWWEKATMSVYTSTSTRTTVLSTHSIIEQLEVELLISKQFVHIRCCPRSAVSILQTWPSDTAWEKCLVTYLMTRQHCGVVVMHQVAECTSITQRHCEVLHLPPTNTSTAPFYGHFTSLRGLANFIAVHGAL